MTLTTLLVILIATIANYFLGAIWYSKALFGNLWISLLGKTEAQMKSQMTNPALAYGTTFLSSFVSAIGLYIAIKAIRHMACVPGHSCLYHTGGTCSVLPLSAICGVVIGIAVSLIFLGTNSLGMTIWEGRPFKLFLLNLSYSIVGFAIMGAILGIYIH